MAGFVPGIMVNVMRGFIIFFIIIVLFLPQLSCLKKEKESRVDIDQLAEDGSTRDRYIFREEISEEKERKQKELREEFR